MDWRSLVNWRLKMLGERALDFIPFGLEIHRALSVNNTNPFVATVREVTVKQKLRHWRFLRETIPLDLRGVNAIEIGTGWAGTDLVFMHLLGVKEIVAIDSMPHLDIRQCRASIDGMLALSGDIERELELKNTATKLAAVPCDNLESFLEYLNVRYVVGKPLSALALPENQYGLFYSFSALHCLPRQELSRTLQSARGLLKSGAVLYNDVQFADNYYRGQEGMNPLGYLRYSEWFMSVIRSRKFNYQSRIRHAEFLSIMDQNGFRFVGEKVDKVSREWVDAIKVADCFAHIDRDDLCVINATMIHRAP